MPEASPLPNWISGNSGWQRTLRPGTQSPPPSFLLDLILKVPVKFLLSQLPLLQLLLPLQVLVLILLLLPLPLPLVQLLLLEILLLL